MRKFLRSGWSPRLIGLLLMMGYTAVSLAQGQILRGKVTDQVTGEGMPGVNIVMKGTSNGTTTDASGAFSISNEGKDGVLVFSFIGYKTMEVNVSSNQTSVDVKLETDVQALQEVVVVGYGTQQKSHLTGAVATTNMENFSKIQTGDALNALQGQVAGVNVSAVSGNPGGTPQVQIRGLGTINGSSPLYVIDGIPSDISYINPSEIESINVLKDASAATIYGARGANGVILITTKRGKSGAPSVSFNSFVGAHKVNLNDINAPSRAERNTILNNSFTNAGLTPPGYTNPANQSQFSDTRWADEYFKTGIEQKYDLGISGGTDQMTYSFQGGYYDHNGTVVNSGIKRYNGRMNLDFKELANGRVNINTGVAFIRRDVRNFNDAVGDPNNNNTGNAGFSDIQDLFQTLPHKAIYDPLSPNGYAGSISSIGTASAGNPVGVRNLNRDLDQNDYIQLNLGAEVKIIEGLSYKMSFGLNSDNRYNDTFIPNYDFGTGYTVETPRIYQFRSRSNQVVMNNLLNFTRQFGLHDVAVLIGQSSERTLYKSLGGSNLELPSANVDALDLGIGTRNSYGLVRENTLLSYFGRVSYNYASKYFLEGSLRKDGSSRFGPSNRWGTFYGVSAGWAIHRENFFSGNAISELKPRYSYGVVGNQNIRDFLFQSIIDVGQTTLNYSLGSGISPLAKTGIIGYRLPNQDIKWEETATQNIGLDLGVLDNALSFTFDYYKSKTKGMLVETKIPSSTGIQISPTKNAGDLENQGFELSVTYKKREGNFKYNISLNGGTSKNKVTQLGFEGQEFVDGYVEYENYPTTRTRVGSQIGEFYLREVNGIFKSQAEIDNYKNKDGDLLQPNASPGDLRFVDVNGDGVLDDDDKKSFGSALPKATFGLNFDATWKNFDFAVMFTGSAGNKMYNAFKMQSYRLGFSRDLLNSWTPQNTDSSIPRLNRDDPNNNYSTPSNFFLEDASYVRLRNLQIGYTIPGNLIGKSGIKKLRVYLGGYNLLTITKYDGFDPGVSNFGKLARGVDRGFYPVSKSFVAGVSIGL